MHVLLRSDLKKKTSTKVAIFKSGPSEPGRKIFFSLSLSPFLQNVRKISKKLKDVFSFLARGATLTTSTSTSASASESATMMMMAAKAKLVRSFFPSFFRSFVRSFVRDASHNFSHMKVNFFG